LTTILSDAYAPVTDSVDVVSGLGEMALCLGRLGVTRICVDGLGDVALSAVAAVAFGDTPPARPRSATAASTSVHATATLSRRPEELGYRVRAVGGKSVPS
jgi:hypothetical protein